MVFFWGMSTKMALTAGALVGGTVAIGVNREQVLEFAADILQKGADFCNEQLNKEKIKMAVQMQDSELVFSEEDLYSEATTPSASEDEDVGSEYDHDDDEVKNSKELWEKLSAESVD